tara:strand:+ start:179 stop:376 length:198 start_codon:yes stop_codon:yes gene_type:complete
MAIYIFCEECDSMVVPKSCKHKKDFNQNHKLSNYINMRRTLSGTTKMEFNTGTVKDSVENMGGTW